MAITKEQLSEVNKQITEIISASRIVEDVCERKVLKRKLEGCDKECHYLPKGKLESADEYSKRIGMTPFSPDTPQIIYDRWGAIFSNPPKLDGSGKESLQEFFERATADGKSIPDLAATAASWMQRVGFMGIALDLPKLTPALQAKKDAGQLSESDIQSAGIRPHAIVYAPQSILDFESDESGVKWVKVFEVEHKRDSFDSKPNPVAVFRIYGQSDIQVYRISNNEVTGPEIIPHGFSRCPFVMVTSPIQNGKLGNSMLIESAECDVAATRILSDLCWNLFLLGNPILALKTHAGENEKRDIGVGAGRYVQLKGGTGQREAEELFFVQLDGTGLEKQYSMWKEMRAMARERAGKAAEAAIAGPSEMSGISRAWEFKTGEERALFLITLRLEAAFNQILDLLLERKGTDPGSAKIVFNTDFDLRSDREKLESNEKALDVFNPFETPTIKKTILKQIADSVLRIPEQDRKAIHAEIDALDMTSEAGGSASEVDRLGKVPLALQQLELARQRYIETGDAKRAAQLAEENNSPEKSMDKK